MLPRKGFDTHGRWGELQCCVFMVVPWAVPFPTSWSGCVTSLKEFHGSCWSWAPAIHREYSRNKGVKVQEMDVPPSPVKGWSKDNTCGHCVPSGGQLI